MNTMSLSCKKYFVSNRGYGILKSELTEDETNDIKNKMTVKPNTFGYSENVEEFPLYLESSKKIYVPKAWGVSMYGDPDEINVSKGDEICCKFKGTLREFQHKPVNAFLEKCYNEVAKNGFTGGILQLPPGWGKTVMALYIASKLKRKTLVIVHKEFLLKQWKDRINQYLEDVTIGIIKGKELKIDADIVLGSLQSISMKDYDNKIFKSFGLVILDECHHLGAQVFSQALQKINVTYSLGLSATVNRKDGLSKVFKWYLGDIIYKAKNEETSEVVVELKNYNGVDMNYCNECKMYNNKPNISRMLNNICECVERTDMIIDDIVKQYMSTKRNILVLSDRRNHLIEMKNKLNNRNILDVGCYIGGMKEHELQKSEEKRILLGTYNMISEGFDLPKLNTLILASPKSDIEQSIGRIQRQLACDREYNPLVIDVIDTFSVFKNQSKKRQDFYKKRKYKIIGEVEKINTQIIEECLL